MAQDDLTQRIENKLAELGHLQARFGEIQASLTKDYQVLLAERSTPAVSIPASSMEIPSINQTTSPAAASSKHELISADSWFSAFQALRQQGSGKTIAINGQTYVRPFTMKENLQARIEDYNTLTNTDGTQRTEEERRRFFNTWLDSCSGIHYLAGTTRFKIIPRSNELITLAQAPINEYLSVPYAQTSAWLAAVEEDQVLLGEAFDIMGAVNNAPADWKGMGFFVYPDKTQDELRPLFVNGQDGCGNAIGRNLLYDDGRLLRR